MKKRYLLPSLLLLLLCCALAVSAHADPIAIDITADRTEVKAGEPVTATYAISGGSGEYDYIELIFERYVSGSMDWVMEHVEDTVENPDLGTTGSFSGVSAAGGLLRFHVCVVDTEGRRNDGFSEAVTVMDGREAEPLRIEISPDKDRAEIGEPVTASYSISGGSGEYDWIFIRCLQRISGGTDWTWKILRPDGVKPDEPFPAEGTLSFTPSFGGDYCFEIDAHDTDSRIADASSGLFTVPDDGTVEPLEIQIGVDKSAVRTGEPVTASWSVAGGNGKYFSIDVIWSQKFPGSSEWIYMKYDDLVTWPDLPLEGMYSFTPTVDGEVHFEIRVEDTDGRAMFVTSDPVTVAAP